MSTYGEPGAVERRFNPAIAEFKPEARSTGDGPAHIVGYASVFNKLSRKLGGFVEKVDNRAFTEWASKGWEGVVARYQHSDDFVLGTIHGGTLMLRTDETGLWYDVVPPSFRQDVVELCQRGDVSSSSFAFCVPDGGDDWGLSDFGYPLRTLLSVDLRDVAPVVTPAYPDATASAYGAVASLARKFDADPEEIRSLLDNNQGSRLFKRSSAPASSKEEEPMALEDQRSALYEEELRAKYDTAAREKMAGSGAAMKDGSYPIADEEDLHNAIHALGRGKNNSHDAIRAHIKKRAEALGLAKLLPDTYGDGDSAEKKSADEDSEGRAAKASYDDLETCGNCGATGQFGKHCTECGNSMEPPPAKAAKGKFCPNCGGKMPAKRDDHKCGEEVRAEAQDDAAEADGEEEEESEDSGGGGSEDEGRSANGFDYEKMSALLGKRYDPYFFESDDE